AAGDGARPGAFLAFPARQPAGQGGCGGRQFEFRAAHGQGLPRPAIACGLNRGWLTCMLVRGGTVTRAADTHHCCGGPARTTERNQGERTCGHGLARNATAASCWCTTTSPRAVLMV